MIIDRKDKSIFMYCHYAQQPPYNTMLRYHNWGKYLHNIGYKVTIVSASTVHNTDIDVIKECNGVSEQSIDGVKYLYVPTPRYSGNGIKRLENMLAYCLGTRKFKKYEDQPDCVVICGAYLMPFIRHIYKNIPVICDIVDLWPLSIVEYTSVSEKNILIRMLYAIEKHAYIRSDALIFSMEGGVDYIREKKYANKVNLNRVFHINMGCDLEEFDKNASRSNDLNCDKNKFTVTYCGSMRKANQIILLCEAARILKERGLSKIQIKLYGNGPDEYSAKKFCQENELSNVLFFGRFQKNELPNILFESDVNIMTYMQSRVMKYGGSQSKLFDYLASGKPIINCGDWSYNLVSLFECGTVVKNQTSEEIAAAIQHLFELPRKDIEEMGKQARKAAEMYDQPKLAEKLVTVINIVTSDEQ